MPLAAIFICDFVRLENNCSNRSTEGPDRTFEGSFDIFDRKSLGKF